MSTSQNIRSGVPQAGSLLIAVAAQIGGSRAGPQHRLTTLRDSALPGRATAKSCWADRVCGNRQIGARSPRTVTGTAGRALRDGSGGNTRSSHGASQRLASPLGLTGPAARLVWLASLGRLEVAGAAFDTRLQGLPAFTGRASTSIGRLLAHHGARIAASPEGFLVEGLTGALVEGGLGRARAWGTAPDAE